MRKLTKEEILLTFTPRVRKKIILPSLEEIVWDQLDFLGWVHPSGHLGYVVYNSPSLGIKSLFLHRAIPKWGRGVRMCSWCNTMRPFREVALFSTTRLYNIERSIGDYICADFGCSLYVRGKPLNIAQMGETISVKEKIQRLHRNIEKFFLLVKKLREKE